MIGWLIAAIAVVVLILFLRRALPQLKDEFRDAIRDAKADVEGGRAARDGRAPIGDQEADDLIAWYRGEARPALLLHPDPDGGASSAPVRLGGEVWLADGEEWPVGKDGRKLEFVAHYDLSRLPPLKGFPTQGVARFFVGRDDLWGADWEVPDQSDVRVLWHDGPQSGGRFEPPLTWGKDENSPFQTVTARADGLALRAEPVADLPDFYSWQVQERLDSLSGRPGLDELEDELLDISEQKQFAHKIGGHPSFTQYDFRKRGQHDDFDVVLLGLSSDEAIMWGDVGEAAFYIRREDLERRDFSRVAFYWDCH